MMEMSRREIDQSNNLLHARIDIQRQQATRLPQERANKSRDLKDAVK
jgi:hypothetical protein